MRKVIKMNKENLKIQYNVDADKVKPEVAPKPVAPKAEVLKTETPKVETKEETNQK